MVLAVVERVYSDSRHKFQKQAEVAGRSVVVAVVEDLEDQQDRSKYLRQPQERSAIAGERSSSPRASEEWRCQAGQRDSRDRERRLPREVAGIVGVGRIGVEKGIPELALGNMWVLRLAYRSKLEVVRMWKLVLGSA